MKCLGSKSLAGVWQRIICQMPPHSVYIEPFFGSGQIFFRKRPAVLNVGIDVDAGSIRSARAKIGAGGSQLLTPGTTLIVGDALEQLLTLKPTMARDAVIYADPPYLFSTRTSRHRYAHEFGNDDQHAALLALLQEMPCRVLLSGYPSKLYSKKLKSWRCITYQTRTRGRTRPECLWANFPEPVELHDWRFIGKGFRERLTLKRFAARFLARLDAMPDLKRNFILHLIDVHQRQKRPRPPAG